MTPQDKSDIRAIVTAVMEEFADKVAEKVASRLMQRGSLEDLDYDTIGDSIQNPGKYFRHPTE